MQNKLKTKELELYVSALWVDTYPYVYSTRFSDAYNKIVTTKIRLAEPRCKRDRQNREAFHNSLIQAQIAWKLTRL